MKYISAQKTQLLDSLENQVLFADLVSVVIGKKGIGKSFLLEQLHQRLHEKIYISEIVADSVMTPEQLNKSICLQLGLSWQISEKELVANIKSNINQRVLISVDNAHLFSVECLNFLLSLILPEEQNPQNLIYIVLTGEAVLANKLNNTETLNKHPNICVVFEIEPFELNETKYFLSELQALDVGKIEILYDEQKLGYFWQLSMGNPRELINQLERWLKNIQSKRQISVFNKVKSASLRQYLLAASYSVIAILLILILVYQDQINELVSPNKESLEVSVSDPAVLEIEDNSITQDITLDELNNALSVKVDEAFIDKNSLSQQELVNPKSLSKNVNNLDLNNSEEKKELIVEESVLSPESIEEKLETKTNNIESTGSQVVKTTFNFSTDEIVLLDIADNFYVIQWMGVSSKESAETFKLSHPLKNELRVFRRKYKNAYLYLLVSGDYKTRQEAELAKSHFVLKKYPGQPWVKSVKAVKQEISDLN